jgi:acetyl-CoA C-acetyltransferase
VEKAAKLAYKQADIAPEKIDFAEVHDCFTIAEICVMEALGLADYGKAGAMIEAGETQIGGNIPVNTSGGLKSKGHPVGATGIAQIIEITHQLRGSAGERQLGTPQVGLAQNMGGSGGSCTIHILEVAS